MGKIHKTKDMELKQQQIKLINQIGITQQWNILSILSSACLEGDFVIGTKH